MKLDHRLRALEGRFAPQMQTVIAAVPMDWDEEDARAQVAELAERQGIAAPFNTWLRQDKGTQDVRIEFAGDLATLLSHIARDSHRIGVTA